MIYGRRVIESILSQLLPVGFYGHCFGPEEPPAAEPIPVAIWAHGAGSRIPKTSFAVHPEFLDGSLQTLCDYLREQSLRAIELIMGNDYDVVLDLGIERIALASQQCVIGADKKGEPRFKKFMLPVRDEEPGMVTVVRPDPVGMHA